MEIKTPFSNFLGTSYRQLSFRSQAKVLDQFSPLSKHENPLEG